MIKGLDSELVSMITKKVTKEFYLSLALHIVSYLSFIAVVIFWFSDSNSFAINRLGNFIQFIAAFSGISALISEARLQEAELWIRKHIIVLISQKTLNIIFVLPSKYISWWRSTIRKISFESLVLTTVITILVLLVLTPLLISHPRLASSDNLDFSKCYEYISLVKYFEMPFYCNFVLPKELNPTLRIIAGISFIAFILYSIPRGSEGDEGCSNILFYVMLLFPATLIAIVSIFASFYWLLGFTVTVLIAATGFMLLISIILLYVLIFSSIALLLTPYRLFDKISNTINQNGNTKARVITVFAVILGCIGTFLTLFE